MTSTMERAKINGVELEFVDAGTGEPVVFIHGAGFADAHLPLAVEPALRDHYRLIRYRRRGHAGSTSIDGPVSIEEHAHDCRALLATLGVEQAHVVGHSYGGCVALQLAVDAPGAIHSLALLEPGLLAVPSAQQFAEIMGPIMEKYTAGDRIAALDDFFSYVLCPEWRAEVNRTVPGGPEQAEDDVATLFESDIPSLQQWRFGATEAAKIKQPVFFLSGTESPPIFVESRELFRSWRPRTENDAMPNVNHLLQMRNPADVAARLADFIKRHTEERSE